MAKLKFLGKDKKRARDLPKLPPINEVKGFPPPPKPGMPTPPKPPKELPSLFEEDVPEELPDFPEFAEEEKPEPLVPDFRPLYEVEEEKKVKKAPKEMLAEIEEPPELEHRHDANRPLFVEVDNFKKMLEDISHIKNDLKSGITIGEKILDVKNEQDRKFSKLKSTMEEMERKLLFVDKTLFEIKYV